MMILSNQNFQKEVLESPIPVLVDFFAPWCPPCRVLGPIIEELDKDYQGKIKIVKFDVDQGVETAQKYGVLSVPTLIIFKNGEEIKRIIGLHSKEELKNEIDKII